MDILILDTALLPTRRRVTPGATQRVDAFPNVITLRSMAEEVDRLVRDEGKTPWDAYEHVARAAHAWRHNDEATQDYEARRG